MGLDLGILVKLTQFLIIMILCLMFAKLYFEDLTFWILLFVKYFFNFLSGKGIIWVTEKYPILLILNLHVYQKTLLFGFYFFVKYLFEFSQWQRYFLGH